MRGRGGRLLIAAAALAVGAALALYLVWGRSWRPWPIEDLVAAPPVRFERARGLPEPRTEAGGAVLDGRLYVIGGIDSFARTLSSAWAYDPAGDAWERLPDLPRKLSHPGVVGVDGRLWVIGGFGPLGIRLRGAMIARWDPLATVYVYDPRAARWDSVAPLPSARGAGGAAHAAGALWYVGGIDPALLPSASLFRLDLATGGWTSMPPMRIARDHLRMEAVGGELFAISGREDDLRFNLPDVERFTIVEGRWSPAAPLGRPRGGFGSVVSDGRIYLFGGEGVWRTMDFVDRYDPALDRWERLPGLPEARHGIVGGVLRDGIHLVSGGRHPRVSISGIHRVMTLPSGSAAR